MSLNVAPVFDILTTDFFRRCVVENWRIIAYAPAQTGGTDVTVLLEDGSKVNYRITDLAAAGLTIAGLNNVTGIATPYSEVLSGGFNSLPVTPVGTVQISGSTGSPANQDALTANLITELADPVSGLIPQVEPVAPLVTENGLIVRPIDARGVADSVSIGGQVTAPLAAAVIATMTPGTAGIYEVYAHASIGLGVPAAGDESNMGLYITATLKQKLPYTGNAGGPFGPYRLTLTAVNTLNVKAIANGTAGVEYVAGITARRVA